MAKKKKKKATSAIESDAAKEGFFVSGSEHEFGARTATFSVDLLISMIADRIRNGEDPEDAAKSVLDLAKEFSEADDVIFDDEKNVTVEEEQKEDPNGD